MPTIHRKLQVNYAASDMFQLVDNIEQYQHFLPWCKESRVLSRTPEIVSATLLLSAKGFQKAFTTCNQLQENKSIDISLINGPFRSLEGRWLFHAETDNSCTLEFDLAFEFSSKFLSLAFSPVFHQLSATLIDAFSARAVQLYGNKYA